MAFPSTSGASPFGNNFKGGGINNHKRPGQGKKLIIKNRKGNLAWMSPLIFFSLSAIPYLFVLFFLFIFTPFLSAFPLFSQ
jgi:hypothetical protein